MDTDFKAWKSKTNFAVSAAKNTSGAAPGSSYRRCPDAGSLKFPQTPLLVRFASARRGPVTAIFLLERVEGHSVLRVPEESCRRSCRARWMIKQSKVADLFT